MSLTIMRRIRFCAGHRLMHHGGMCENFHGHNYVADFYVEGDKQDEIGRVIDFSVLKKLMKTWLDDNWDHGFLIHQDDDNARQGLKIIKPFRYFEMPYNPTAENMALYLLKEVCPGLLAGTGARATGVRIWETDDSFAEAKIDGESGETVVMAAMADEI